MVLGRVRLAEATEICPDRYAVTGRLVPGWRSGNRCHIVGSLRC